MHLKIYVTVQVLITLFHITYLTYATAHSGIIENSSTIEPLLHGKNMKVRCLRLALNIKAEVDTVIGFFDIPPYVTIVPPCLQQTCYLSLFLAS